MMPQLNKKLAEFEFNKLRSNPQKYLWDALDRYFSVLIVTPGVSFNLNEMLTMRIWAADDVEMCAKAANIISIFPDNDGKPSAYKTELDKLVDDGQIEIKNKIARLKVGLCLRAMKAQELTGLNLEM